MSISLLAQCLDSGPMVWAPILSANLANLFSVNLAWGMTMAARPLSLSLQAYALNLTYGLIGTTLLRR